jgi:sec-independent protein translocase protein TatC
MPRAHDEDLFKDSTMSFGEHLEELRAALFKAILAISIGFAIGLAWLGGWVVQRVQDPLKAALEKYYTEQAEEDFNERMKRREEAGEITPAELKDPKYVNELINGRQMLFEEAYVDPAQVLDGLKAKFPEQLKDFSVPKRDASTPPEKSDLLRLFLWHTIKDDLRIRVVGLNAQEAFLIYMKASLIAGIVLSSPAALYFLWSFVAAGLYRHERKYVYIFLPFSLALFLAGASLAFFAVFPPVLDFFFSFNKWLKIDPDPRISEWMGFVLMLPIAFGVSFQLPLVMLFLQRIGVFTTQAYLASWRIAILVITIAAAVITPSVDPTSMMMLLVPLTLLYFGGILLCKWMPGGGRNPYQSS